MVKVSIIVPIYNTEQYLDRCVKSLVNQTLKDIEIILVDDESPDNAPRMCDEYAKEDPRIRVIHKKNGGLGFARNSGLEIATGEYIGFVDSDDYVETNMFEKLYNIATVENAEVAYGNYKFITDGECTGETKFVTEKTVWEGQEQIRKFLFDIIAPEPESNQDSKYGASVWKGIFKKSIFDKYGIRFVSERKLNSEDRVFDIDYLPKINKIVMIPDPLYCYQYNGSSLTTTYKSDRFDKDCILYRYIRERLKDYYKEDNIDYKIGRALITTARIAIIHEVMHWKDNREELKNHVKKICDNETLKEVMDVYPYKRLPLKYRYFAVAIRSGNVFLLKLMVKMFYQFNSISKRR